MPPPASRSLRPRIAAGAPARALPRDRTPRATGEPLYVSSVQGRPVTRLGSTDLIGAVRGPDRRIEYRTEDIVVIPAAELSTAHRRAVYERLIADGHLKKRTTAEYEAQKLSRKENDPARPASKNQADAAKAPAAKTPAAPAGG